MAGGDPHLPHFNHTSHRPRDFLVACGGVRSAAGCCVLQFCLARCCYFRSTGYCCARAAATHYGAGWRQRFFSSIMIRFAGGGRGPGRLWWQWLLLLPPAFPMGVVFTDGPPLLRPKWQPSVKQPGGGITTVRHGTLGGSLKYDGAHGRKGSLTSEPQTWVSPLVKPKPRPAACWGG